MAGAPHALGKEVGVVLAGGMGRRMGGEDKGLVVFRGRPLVQHAIDRLHPQVDGLLLNANRNAETYATFGHPVAPDRLDDYQGPLAGMAASLAWLADHSPASVAITTVPCDAPRLPLDLAERLRAGAADGQGAVAACGGWLQPVFARIPTTLLPSLEGFLASGERKIDRWFEAEGFAVVTFEDEAAFANLNRPEDLTRHSSGAGA